MGLLATGNVRATEPFSTYCDLPQDSVALRTDPGGLTLMSDDINSRVELLEITIGNWSPTDAMLDLFAGEYISSGSFLRLELILDGLVNPPGSVDPIDFDPFAFGNFPIYGFVELDVDDDIDTGGELDAVSYRYAGNIARFGGLPGSRAYQDRVAIDDSDIDTSFLSEPQVERSGDDFHLSLLGNYVQVSGLDEIVGNGDLIFDAGESWNVCGPFLHRAHGYEPYSFADGGFFPGEYMPDVCLRFDHNAVANITSLSVVFPLDNAASALMRGELVEPIDQDPTNQASILEGLDDLVLSAEYLDTSGTGDPSKAIILDWKDKDPSRFLEASRWRVNALLGMSYLKPHALGEFFVWTDAYPNVFPGDVNGEYRSNADDRDEVLAYIKDHDLDDGLLDGLVVVLNAFAGFTVFDVNQDGQVDALDAVFPDYAGDLDLDDDVDLFDMSLAQVLLSYCNTTFTCDVCTKVDINDDRHIDLSDVAPLLLGLSGPSAPADP